MDTTTILNIVLVLALIYLIAQLTSRVRDLEAEQRALKKTLREYFDLAQGSFNKLHEGFIAQKDLQQEQSKIIREQGQLMAQVVSRIEIHDNWMIAAGERNFARSRAADTRPGKYVGG